MTLLFGHRGARGEAPENTVPGFRYGVGIGLTAFELDVRLSADGRLFVLHDESLQRTTNGSGPGKDRTIAELAALDARGEHPDWPERCWVPALDEVLSACPEISRWELEIKGDEPERLAEIARLLADAVARFGIAEKATVSSFSAVALHCMIEAAPELKRGFIGKYDSDEDLAAARRLRCVQADIPIASSAVEMVRAAHDAGLLVTGWMGNTRDAAATLEAWGVDHITTDYPSLLMNRA